MIVYKKVNLTGLVLGPIFFLLIFLLIPESELTYAPRVVLGVTAWTATWWVTEALPIPATSLLPIILLPTLGGLSMEQTSRAYGDPIVFMYMGGFMIAIAIEKWNLHRRMALHILNIIGTRSDRIVLGVMMATAFLSMWISNAATALMMLPVALAVIKEVKANDILSGASRTDSVKAFYYRSLIQPLLADWRHLWVLCQMLFLAAMSKKLLDREIMFFEWFLFGFPVAAVLLILLFLYLTRIQFKVEHTGEMGAAFIRKGLEDLGKMKEEKWVFAIFLMMAFLWIFKIFLFGGLLSGYVDRNLWGDAVISYSSDKWRENTRMAGYEAVAMGAFAFVWRRAFARYRICGNESTGWIGENLQHLNGLSYLMLLIILTASILFMTEIMSNTAVANMIIPITVGLGLAIGMEPYGLMAAAALASSCAFMLPISTPPNASLAGTC